MGDDLEENKIKMLENINNGKAFDKFEEMVRNQGGDISYLENTEKFEKAKFIESVKADKNGYIKEINAEDVGKIACNLGAGRIKKEDQIDYTVGVKLCKKNSEEVIEGEDIAYIYANDVEKLKIAKQKLMEIIKIDVEKVKARTNNFWNL